MCQIWFILLIETFPNNAPYFPMDKDFDRETTSLYQLVCGVVSGDTLVCRHGQLQYCLNSLICNRCNSEYIGLRGSNTEIKVA